MVERNGSAPSVVKSTLVEPIYDRARVVWGVGRDNVDQTIDLIVIS